MSASNTLNGTAYDTPTSGDDDWGADLAAYLAAIASSCAASFLSFGATATPANTSSNYLRPGLLTGTADTTAVSIRVPFAAKVSKLYVQASTGPVTQGQTITVRKNSVDQTLLVALGAGSTQASDLTHSFTVAAGDQISVKVVGTTGIATGAVNLIVTMLLTHQ